MTTILRSTLGLLLVQRWLFWNPPPPSSSSIRFIYGIQQQPQQYMNNIHRYYNTNTNTNTNNKNNNNNDNTKHNRNNHFYLKPCEIFIDSTVRVALQSLRDQQHVFQKNYNKNHNNNTDNKQERNQHKPNSNNDYDTDTDTDDDTDDETDYDTDADDDDNNTNENNKKKDRRLSLDSNYYKHVIDSCYREEEYKYYDDYDDSHRTLDSTFCFDNNKGIHSNEKNSINTLPVISVTLTLCGKKGGKIEEQTNQDRAFIVYYDRMDHINNNETNQNFAVQQNLLVSGVLDGHGDSGHYVAEWSRYEIIKRFQEELFFPSSSSSSTKSFTDENVNDKNNSNKNIDDNDIIPEILQTIMIETDSKLPNKIAMDGGATASFVIQKKMIRATKTMPPSTSASASTTTTTTTTTSQDNNDHCNDKTRNGYIHNGDDNNKDDDDTMIYFCNAGDSQSFLVASIITTSSTTSTMSENTPEDDTVESGTTTNTTTTTTTTTTTSITNIVYFETQLDKPDLPQEKERIEKVPGMYVKGGRKNDDDTARVWYRSTKRGGGMYGLAMSRGLGDREATAVIAVPTITRYSKNHIIHEIVDRVNMGTIQLSPSTTTSSSTSTTSTTKKLPKRKEENVEVEECIIMDPMTGICSESIDESSIGQQKQQQPTNGTTLIISAKNVQLFVVSADGIMDFITPQEIANTIGPSLYVFGNNNNNNNNNNININYNNDDTINDSTTKYSSSTTIKHPITATEDVILKAATEWQKEYNGKYRDDIAIAVTHII